MLSWQSGKVLALSVTLFVCAGCAFSAQTDEGRSGRQSTGRTSVELESMGTKADSQKRIQSLAVEGRAASPMQIYSPLEAKLIDQVLEMLDQERQAKEVSDMPVAHGVVGLVRNNLTRRQQPIPVLASHYGQVGYRTVILPGRLELVMEPEELENGRALSYKRRFDFRLWTMRSSNDRRYDGRLKMRFSGSRREGYVFFEKPF